MESMVPKVMCFGARSCVTSLDIYLLIVIIKFLENNKTTKDNNQASKQCTMLANHAISSARNHVKSMTI